MKELTGEVHELEQTVNRLKVQLEKAGIKAAASAGPSEPGKHAEAPERIVAEMKRAIAAAEKQAVGALLRIAREEEKKGHTSRCCAICDMALDIDPRSTAAQGMLARNRKRVPYTAYSRRFRIPAGLTWQGLPKDPNNVMLLREALVLGPYPQRAGRDRQVPEVIRHVAEGKPEKPLGSKHLTRVLGQGGTFEGPAGPNFLYYVAYLVSDQEGEVVLATAGKKADLYLDGQPITGQSVMTMPQHKVRVLVARSRGHDQSFTLHITSTEIRIKQGVLAGKQGKPPTE